MSEKDPPPQYQPPAAGYPPATSPPGYPPVPVQLEPGYPSAPQPGMHPLPPPGYQAQTVVVTQQGGMAMYGGTARYQQFPACITCQHCQATVTTTMEYENGLLTWMAVGGTCLVGCWLGCCFIPFCIDSLKDVIHRCPNCNNVVGKFRHVS